MILDDISAEKRRIRAIASDYRIRGYTVLEEPSPEQLPDFLAGYSPTMVAHKGGDSAESVVIVVQARQRPGKEYRVGELAELLRTKPGWKFELALVETEALVDTPNTAIPFGRDDIRDAMKLRINCSLRDFTVPLCCKRGRQQRRLFDYCLMKNGCLRRSSGGGSTRSQPPFGSAVYYGVISHEDYSALMDAVGHRNAYVHGFTLPDFDPVQAVGTIISTTERLLECQLPESD